MEIKFAELTNGSIKPRAPGRLKWPMVMLKGGSRMDASTLKWAPPGSSFTLESQTGADAATVAELRAAINAGERFDLLLTGTSNAAMLKAGDTTSCTVKTLKVTKSGFGIEIGLRKG